MKSMKKINQNLYTPDGSAKASIKAVIKLQDDAKDYLLKIGFVKKIKPPIADNDR